jgi:ABC-type multidrug transport system fused ATPase/permease subunit
MNISVFDNILEKDESLEWVGRPEPFAVIDEVNKKSIHTRWIISVVAAVVINALYLGLSLGAGLFIFKAFALIITIGVPFYFCIVPFIDRNVLRKRNYAITNKRIIIHAGESSINSMELSAIDQVRVVETQNGNGHVIIGAKFANIPEVKLRKFALSPKTETVEEKERTIAIVLYNIAGVKKVKSLLADAVKA